MLWTDGRHLLKRTENENDRNCYSGNDVLKFIFNKI